MRATPMKAPQWRSCVLLATLLVILLGYVAWVLSLPCFPTTDGPVHMYYVHVFGDLLSHQNAPYARYFRIRHLFPPYALYYYALLGLSHLMPLLLADRLIICVYFVSFVFGFRYLARAIGPSADLMTLLATLLLVNWPLGMGFVNFCLSLSFSLWATGLWLRILGTANLWGRVGFLLFVSVIMFTHPVPLLLLLSVTGSVLLTRLLQARYAHAGAGLPQHWRADVLTWLLAACNLVYVKLFTVANPLKQVERVPYWTGMISRIHDYARERMLTTINGTRWDVLTYRCALGLVLLVPLFLAIRQRLRHRRAGIWTVGDIVLVLGLILLIGLPLLPSQLNGLYYFADRLMICIWIAFLLAASGWSGASALTPRSDFVDQPARGMIAAGIACVLVASFALFHALEGLVRPPARIVAELGAQVSAPQNALAFVMEDARDKFGQTRINLAYDPYYWAGVHVLRTHDDIMVNAPWMDESIIPITDTSALPQVALPALQPPYPDHLQKALSQAPDQLAATLQQVRFFVVNQEERTPLAGPEPLLEAAKAPAHEWHCVAAGAEVFRICTKQPSAP